MAQITGSGTDILQSLRAVVSPVDFRLPWARCKCSWFALDQEGTGENPVIWLMFLKHLLCAGSWARHWQGCGVEVPVEDWAGSAGGG